MVNGVWGELPHHVQSQVPLPGGVDGGGLNSGGVGIVGGTG